MKNNIFYKTQYLNLLQIIKQSKLAVLSCLYFVIFSFALMPFMYNMMAYVNCCSIYELKKESMQPTFNQNKDFNDLAIVDSSLDIEVGKVIMYCLLDLTVPNDPTTNVTKRVIALEGDKITVATDDGVNFYIKRIANGNQTPYIMQEQYQENYKKNKDVYNDFQQLYKRSDIQTEIEDDGNTYIVIPKNCMFLLGDNRDNSKDSSEYGPVNVSGYRGTAVYHIKEGKNFNLYQLLYAFGLIKSNI